jgi:hypothetical protein
MPITITCQCQKSFQAPDLLAGRTVKCPNCARPLEIPHLPDHSDLFDELADLAAAADFAPPAGAVPARRGAGLGAAPHALTLHRPARSVPLGLIAGGGVAAVTVVALIVVLVAAGPDRSERRSVADAPSDVQPSNVGPAVPAATRPLVRSNAGPASQSESGPNASTPPEHATVGGESPLVGGLQMLTRRFTGASGAASPGNASAVAAAPAAGHFDAKLRPSLLAWHASGKLVSTRRAGDAEMYELHYGWMVGLLPHLGYQEHFDDFDFDKPWHDKANLEHAAREIPEFLNPADSRKQYEGYRYGGMALTHFVGVSGVEDGRNVVAATLPRSDSRAGIFGYEDIAKPAEIKDGTSRTLMLIGSGELACPWVQSGGSTVRGARQPYFGELTGFGTSGGPGKGALGVMADGSVRWIEGGVDPQVFRAMCTIGGGE